MRPDRVTRFGLMRFRKAIQYIPYTYAEYGLRRTNG